jgi:hypothetical protein
MNASFMLEGTGLPTGVVTVMLVGRTVAWFTTAWAALTFALELLDEAFELLELGVLLDDPQPAAISATAAPRPARPARRRTAGGVCLSTGMDAPPGDVVTA